MSMVEGIGDEVLQFFGILIILGIALIAWWSTSISEGPLIRTVLILERRSRGRRPNDSAPQQPINLDISDTPIDTGQVNPTSLPELVENEGEDGDRSRDKDENESTSSLLLPGGQQPVDTAMGEQNPEIPAVQPVPPPQPASQQESEARSEADPPNDTDSSTVTSSDADSSILRKRRLAFFQSRGPTLIETSDTITNEPDAAPIAETVTQEEEEEEEESTSPDHIRIRLKYLNDDQIVVEGRLQEQLGDFKRRHFSIELAAEKMVRLIFNGQVLQSDSQTLQGYGLFDNCVVHCLVHNQRNNAPPSTQPQTNSGSNQSTPPDWNLGTLLYTCVSVILGFAWYCRYQYSHLFTVTTTAALFGLTSMFAVTLLSIYLPDQETIQ